MELDPIPFADYLPDLPDFGPGSSNILNVIPHAKSYKQFRDLSQYSTAIGEYCRGATWMEDTSGTFYNFAGDRNKLYQLSGTSWTDVSKSTAVTAYSTASAEQWEFIKWGNKAIATNYSDNLQVITLGSANFADLGGSPPKARHINVVRDFIVLGDIASAPNRVQWSGINNETQWASSAPLQSDSQDLQGNFGAVMAIVGGERGYIFQEHAIWLMTYIGSPVIFQFDLIEDSRGAFASKSVIKVGSMIFYLSDDGFYKMEGGNSTPIGANRIDKTFFNDLDSSNSYRITCTADISNKLIVWAYPGSGNSGGTPNKLLIYDYINDKWTPAQIATEQLFRSVSTGYTLEQLTAVSQSLDTLPASLDSRQWAGGKLSFAAFNSSHQYATFTGTALTATVETSETDLSLFIKDKSGSSDGRMMHVTEVRPIIAGGTHTVSVGTRNTQNETVSYSAASSENTSGFYPIRTNSRYQRFKVDISGGFTDAVAAQPRVFRSGKR